MFLHSTFRLTSVLDSEKFTKLLDSAYSTLECYDEDVFVDDAFAPKGLRFCIKIVNTRRK